MKGVIVKCLSELVITNFGKDKWEDTLEKSGLSKNSTFLATSNVDDETVLHVVGILCEILDISLTQAADAFGEYWVNQFAPKIYGAYFQEAKNAREFLLNMDNIHLITTESIPDAQPPRFDYSWENDNVLIMKYKSKRNMIDFAIGLVKGVGSYFDEELDVSKRGTNKIKIVFPE